MTPKDPSARRNGYKVDLFERKPLRQSMIEKGHDPKVIDRILKDIIACGYGIAPMRPTNGMLAASLRVTRPPERIDATLTAIAKATKRWEAMMTQGLKRAFSHRAPDMPEQECNRDLET